MKIVIVGAGEVGTEIARQLSDEGKDVVLIEKDPARVKIVSSFLDTLVVQGEGTDGDVLREAGAAGADIFIAATTSDEANLISCFIVAAEFETPVKIARVRGEQYSHSKAFSSRMSGVDYLVNTDLETAWEITQNVEQGATSSLTIFKNSDIQMRDYHIGSHSFFRDKYIRDLRTDLKEDFIIAGVVRDNEVNIPLGDFQIQKGDQIYMVAHKRTFYRLSSRLGYKADKLRRIAVLGGTPIGIGVAELLSSKGRKVMIIDKDYEHCKYLAEILPEVMVLNGDITDNKLFMDEGLETMDAIVTATSNEELNIIGGIYVKSLGVKRAVAVVEKTSYLPLASNVGIDATISPKYSAINSILKFIRKGNVRSVHSIFEGQAEAMDVTLPAGSSLTEKPLKELQLPEDVVIAAVNRKRASIIPTGDLQLQPGDNVILFAKRTVIPDVERLLVP